MATTKWDGEWRPMLPLTQREMSRTRMVGIAPLAIDGREIQCVIYLTPKGQNIARAIADKSDAQQGQWYQPCRA